VLRAAGVVATDVLAASAAGVAAFVSGVGLVLLIVGIGATVFAIVSTRTELQRWAGRSYFGNGEDDKPKFKTAAEEDTELAKALGVAAVDEVKGSALLERDLATEAANYG
jgi:hypothetical protein